MKRLSPTRRLYIKVSELKEQMERLVAHDGTPEAIVKLSRVERRYWPLQAELLRRMDERDANAAKAKAWDAFVLWATEPDQLKYSREREWGEWMEIFTGWVGHAFPEVWPLARPPYVRDQWYIDQENKR